MKFRPIRPPWWRPLERLAIESKRRRLKAMGIRSNCLLTQAPLAFIHSDPGAFGFLPEFLFEHGYRVEVHLDHKSLRGPAHVFLISDSKRQDSSTSDALESSRSVTNLELSWRSRLNENLDFEHQILEHAISLAEAEWK